MAYVKTYGRNEFRLLDEKAKLSSDNMRTRNVFSDSPEDSPTDPFDKLFKAYKVDLDKKTKSKKKRMKYKDENYDFASSGDSEFEFKLHKRNISKKDNSNSTPKKPLENKTNFVTKRTKKEIIPKANPRKCKLESYPDFSLIEETELVIEDEFPTAKKHQNTRKIFPQKPLPTTTTNDFQTSKTKTKTRKNPILNWTSSPSTTSTPSKTTQKIQLITTSTPQTHNSRPQTAVPKISPIINNNSVMDIELSKRRSETVELSKRRSETVELSRRRSEDNSIKQCSVLLEKLSNSFLKTYKSVEKVPSLCKTMGKMSSFEGSAKRVGGNEGKRSYSPCVDELLRVSRKSTKIVRLSKKPNDITKILAISGRKPCRTSILVSLTPLDYSVTGQSICGCKTVLTHCDQTEPMVFEDYARSVTHVCKIGEGSYGEVFKALNTQQDTIVIKIQAITQEKQLTFDEVWPEIVSATRLSELGADKNNLTTTFVRVNGTVCLKGVYPKPFLRAWDVYNREKMASENIRPSLYDKNQLYVSYEIKDGGCDLEKYQINNYSQAMSIFLQVASALAVAERAVKFEHRDLHWGNILVAHTVQEHVKFKLDGKDMKIVTHNVVATIIDYSLSRIEEDGCTLYNDLNNATGIFSGKGDYQFDVYRKMRDATKGSWKGFYPVTNILWLHYLLDKLCNNKTYKNRRRVHNDAVDQMKIWAKEILKFSSAREFVEENKKFFTQC